jgi:hypothetical protein
VWQVTINAVGAAAPPGVQEACLRCAAGGRRSRRRRYVVRNAVVPLRRRGCSQEPEARGITAVRGATSASNFGAARCAAGRGAVVCGGDG